MAVIRFSAGRERHVLHVLAVDGIEEGDLGARRRDRLLEAVEPLVLDEGVEGADDAELGRAAHVLLDVLAEELADLLAGGGVVDADEGGVVAVGDLRVDGDTGMPAAFAAVTAGFTPLTSMATRMMPSTFCVM